jgi:hypothetical protein
MAYKYLRLAVAAYLIFREELDRQRAQANYQRMHAEGKTEEARADLARLAIIKQQRAEAAKRREEEKQSMVTLATLRRYTEKFGEFGRKKDSYQNSLFTQSPSK